jgi:hypothetical protein
MDVVNERPQTVPLAVVVAHLVRVEPESEPRIRVRGAAGVAGLVVEDDGHTVGRAQNPRGGTMGSGQITGFEPRPASQAG